MAPACLPEGKAEIKLRELSELIRNDLLFILWVTRAFEMRGGPGDSGDCISQVLMPTQPTGPPALLIPLNLCLFQDREALGDFCGHTQVPTTADLFGSLSLAALLVSGWAPSKKFQSLLTWGDGSWGHMAAPLVRPFQRTDVSGTLPLLRCLPWLPCATLPA